MTACNSHCRNFKTTNVGPTLMIFLIVRTWRFRFPFLLQKAHIVNPCKHPPYKKKNLESGKRISY